MCTFLLMPDTDPYADPELDEEWLSIGEAAALIGLSVQTLRRYDISGRLSAHRSPGGQRRYRRSDVLDALVPAAS